MLPRYVSVQKECTKLVVWEYLNCKYNSLDYKLSYSLGWKQCGKWIESENVDSTFSLSIQLRYRACRNASLVNANFCQSNVSYYYFVGGNWWNIVIVLETIEEQKISERSSFNSQNKKGAQKGKRLGIQIRHFCLQRNPEDEQ